MIISHKYKFIFVKAQKVGGTSIEDALSKHCDKNDVIARRKKTATTLGYHASAMEIKRKVGYPIWNRYFKFSIVRNPWDVLVSEFWFRKWRNENNKRKLSKRDWFLPFNELVKRLSENARGGMNYRYYFNPAGDPLLDFYIKYENLEPDYKKVCGRIGIPFELPPRRNAFQRLNNRHYSTYYDAEYRNIVAENHKRIIEFFGYEFEDKGGRLED